MVCKEPVGSGRFRPSRNDLGDHRGATAPLFLMPDGHALSRSSFVKRLRLLLPILGVDAALYSPHSFRIGAASTAARANIPVYLIKILGRWSSSAYRRYLRHLRHSLRRSPLWLLHYLHQSGARSNLYEFRAYGPLPPLSSMQDHEEGWPLFVQIKEARGEHEILVGGKTPTVVHDRV